MDFLLYLCVPGKSFRMYVCVYTTSSHFLPLFYTLHNNKGLGLLGIRFCFTPSHSLNTPYCETPYNLIIATSPLGETLSNLYPVPLSSTPFLTSHQFQSSIHTIGAWVASIQRISLLTHSSS